MRHINYLAAEAGLEPTLNESESFVLPLHNSAMLYYLSIYLFFFQVIFLFFEIVFTCRLFTTFYKLEFVEVLFKKLSNI